MKARRAMWIVILGLPVVVLVAIAGLVVASWRRPELGAVDGRLRPCPDSPNCVCSFDNDEPHGIEPLPGGEDAIGQLRQALSIMPGVEIIADDGEYLHAECTTPRLRYVDDIEFLRDAEADVIHVRSASRVGRSDLGANRTRVEHIRQLMTP